MAGFSFVRRYGSGLITKVLPRLWAVLSSLRTSSRVQSVAGVAWRRNASGPVGTGKRIDDAGQRDTGPIGADQRTAEGFELKQWS